MNRSLKILNMLDESKTEVTVKNKADIENVFGKNLAKKIMALPELKKGKKKKPSYIYLATEKPEFYVDDGGGLFAFSVDLAKEEITSPVKYYGSGSSTINYTKGQLDQGGTAPENNALVFIEYYQGYYGYTLTVVSPNIKTQIEQ